MKICPRCKKDKHNVEFSIDKVRKDGLQVWCRDCFRDYRRANRSKKAGYNREYRATNRKRVLRTTKEWVQQNAAHRKRYFEDYFQTPRGRASKLYSEAKRRASTRGIPFSLSVQDILGPLELGICQATRLSLDFVTVAGPFSPSVDRIDSAKGYSPDNIHIVVLIYNLAKRNWAHEDVVEFAQALVEARRNI